MNRLIEKIKVHAKENYIPIVRDRTIQTINEILRHENSKKVLEIGTATGYSTLMMLLSNENLYVTTIEKDEVRYKLAEENFREAGVEKRVKLILGDAYQQIEALKNDKEKFDFIFLDGPKGQYIRYFPILCDLLNEGGIIFADNVLLGGLLNDKKEVTHKNRSMVNNMKMFIKTVEEDKRFITKEFDIDDGFVVSKLKKSTD